MNASGLNKMRALLSKDCMALRVPVLASIVVGIACYLVPLAGEWFMPADESPVVMDPSPWNPVRIEQAPPQDGHPTPPKLVPQRVRPIFPAAQIAKPHSRIQANSIANASQVAMVVTAVLAAAFGGVAIAGERSERTAEFVAVLPVTRGQIILSKLTVCFAVLLGCTAIHAGIAASLWYSGVWQPVTRVWHAEAILWMGWICSFFGVAWMLSTWMRSAPISACTSIGLTISASVATDLIFRANEMTDWRIVLLNAMPLSVIGLASFATGTCYYLQRITP